MRYSDRERQHYTPSPCPVCGGPTEVTWVGAIGMGEDPDDPDQPQWLPGRTTCRDFGHGEE